jgi:hypothetical protein
MVGDGSGRRVHNAMSDSYLAWPLEESLTHTAMLHVERALEAYLGKRWPLPEGVEAELLNTRNAIHNMLERVPSDNDLLS